MIISKKTFLSTKRIKAGLSKNQLAKISGVHPSVVIRAEKGISVSPKTAKAICDVLNATFDELFEIIDERKDI